MKRFNETGIFQFWRKKRLLENLFESNKNFNMGGTCLFICLFFKPRDYWFLFNILLIFLFHFCLHFVSLPHEKVFFS